MEALGRRRMDYRGRVQKEFRVVPDASPALQGEGMSVPATRRRLCAVNLGGNTVISSQNERTVFFCYKKLFFGGNKNV